MNLKNFLAWMCVLPIQVVMINLAMGMDPDSPVDFEIVTCFGCDFQQRKMLAIETAGHDSGFFKIVVFDPISEDADSFTVRIVVENEPGGSFTSTRVRTIAVPAEFQVAMGLYLEYMDIVESVEPVELPASFSNPPGQVTFP